MKKILVIGSVNVDHTTFCQVVPRGGETILGLSYQSVIGGKGANQAVAAALAGGDVTFFCAVGNDADGNKVRSELVNVPMNIVYKESNLSTGIATILVEASTAQNRIVVVSGANYDITKETIDNNEDLIKECDYLLLQLEIPLESVVEAVKLAKKHHKTVVLNPAPARELPKELLSQVDYLTPNESELQILTGIDTSTKEGCLKAANYLFDLGVNNLILTRGTHGSILITKKGTVDIKPFKVNAIDTTAAGDCYNGVFLSYFASGLSLEYALTYASKASAISVTRKGAITSLPTKEEIEGINL